MKDGVRDRTPHAIGELKQTAARLKPERYAPDDPIHSPGWHRQKRETADDGIISASLADPCRRQPGSAAPDDPRTGEAVGKKLCEAFIQFDQCQLLLGKSPRQKRTGEDAFRFC